MRPWKSLKALVWIVGVASAIEVSAQTDITFRFSVGGKMRHSLAHVPAGVEKPPVVFFIHGANGSGPNFRNETKADAVADREKFIAVYPSASDNGNAGVWDDMRGKGNFPFFLALIDSLDARAPVDRDRIYMTGFSQGGFISFAAACFYSDVFAAVAPVSGHAVEPCELERPVPVYMTFGANEEPSNSFVADFDLWRELDGCGGEPTDPVSYPESNPGTKVKRVASGECQDGASVLLDSIAGQGHQWPSASTRNQADEAWRFFKPHTLEATTALRGESLRRPSHPSAWAQSGRRLRWEGPYPATSAVLTDLRGHRVRLRFAQGRDLSLQGLAAGFWTLSAETQGGAVHRVILIP